MVLHPSCLRRGEPRATCSPGSPCTPRRLHSHTLVHPNRLLPLLGVCSSIGLLSLAACGRPPATGASRTPSAPHAGDTATPTLIGGAGWRVYQDPRGTFSLQIPPDWTADVGTGSWIAPGGPTPDYTIRLGNPPDPTSTPIAFQIDYHALVGAAGHAYGCGAVAQATRTVGGLPALYLDVRGHEEWYVPSASNLYLLSWAWPGYGGDFPGLQSQPSMPDSQTWQVDQALAARIVASFHPQPATPLVCP